MSYSVLIVDDDQDIRALVRDALMREGYHADTAQDGDDMEVALKRRRYDVVLLDIMMPGRDGLSLCRDIRTSHPETAIVMISAKGQDIDKIVGLEVGADDYLAKPFNSRELIARIRAVMRRVQPDGAAAPAPNNTQDKAIRFAGFALDAGRHALTREEDGQDIDLTSGEFALLLALAQSKGRAVDRNRLLNVTAGRDAMPYDRSIDVLISRLRKKLGDDSTPPRLIKTIRNVGYMLTDG